MCCSNVQIGSPTSTLSSSNSGISLVPYTRIRWHGGEGVDIGGVFRMGTGVNVDNNKLLN